MNAISVIKKNVFANHGRTFIVGQRSWISRHLQIELESRGRNPEYLMKAAVGDEPLNGSTLYLIAGVARPNRVDMDREEDLCGRASDSGARVIYLSSCAVDRWEAHSRMLSPEGELYVLGKKRCEQLVTGGPSGCGYALRAPVIFGPGQRLECGMLLPDIIQTCRDGLEPIRLQEPFRPFEMVYVLDLVRAMADLGELGASNGAFPVTSVRASATITPVELCALAAPGHPVVLKKGWTPHVPSPVDRTDMRHVPRVEIPFRREDVVSTVMWYNEQVPELVAPGTLLLEG